MLNNNVLYDRVAFGDAINEYFLGYMILMGCSLDSIDQRRNKDHLN